MSSVRAQLQGALQLFLTDTFSHMRTLRSFMEESEELLKIFQSAEEQMDQMGRVSPVAMCCRKREEKKSLCCCFCFPCSKQGEPEDNCLCCFVPCRNQKGTQEDSCLCCCAPWSKKPEENCLWYCVPCSTREETDPKNNCLCCFVPCCSSQEGQETCLCCCCSCSSLEKKKRRNWTNQLNKAVNDIQQQLEKLERPLQAIERLAVTSERVFEKDPLEQVDLRTVDLRAVCRVLSAVKAMSPWVIVLKQAEIFKAKTGEPQTPNPNENIERPQNVNSNEGIQLLPRTADRPETTTSTEKNIEPLLTSLENVEALQLRLQTLICALRNICCLLKDSALMEICLDQSEVRVSEELSEERAAQMLSIVQELQRLREDGDSRMGCLLRDEEQTSVGQFNQRKPQMDQCVKDLRKCAEKLECMNRGRLFFGLVSSVVGVGEGVVSLRGLIGVNMGYSYLLLYGLGFSGLAGVISLLTMVADVVEKRKWKTEASFVCEKFKGHMNVFQRSLNSATFSPTDRMPAEDQTIPGSLIGSKAVFLSQTIFTMLDVITATDVYDIQQVALRGPWFKSTLSYWFGIVTNSWCLFLNLGISIYLIWALIMKPAVAQWLRARASLWAAEVETWTQIFKSLEKGQPRAQRNIQLLRKTFY